MKQLSDFDRLLEVQAMACVFYHDDVVIGHVAQVLCVKRAIVEYVPLERLGTIKQKATTIECLIGQLWETKYVLLICPDSLKIHLEGAIWIKIEKKRCFKDFIAYVTFDLFNRVFQWHIFKTAESDGFFYHSCGRFVELWARAAINRGRIE